MQGGDNIRVVAVVFTVVDVPDQPTLPHRLAGLPCISCKLQLIVMQIIEFRPLNAANRSGEASLDHFVVQSDDFEQLRTAITGNRRNSHLRHDLEQSLDDTAPVIAAELPPLVDGALAPEVIKGLIGEIRVDCRRPVADQCRKMMRIPGNSGLNENIGGASQTLLDKVMVNSPGCEQRMNRNKSLLQVPVTEQ